MPFLESCFRDRVITLIDPVYLYSKNKLQNGIQPFNFRFTLNILLAVLTASVNSM